MQPAATTEEASAAGARGYFSLLSVSSGMSSSSLLSRNDRNQYLFMCVYKVLRLENSFLYAFEGADFLMMMLMMTCRVVFCLPYIIAMYR